MHDRTAEVGSPSKQRLTVLVARLLTQGARRFASPEEMRGNGSPIDFLDAVAT
jgi:hypothetical protein